MLKALSSNIFRKTWAIAILSFAIAGTIFAADAVQGLKDRGKKYYWGMDGEQNYSKALQLYLQAAEAGDAEAQYISGGMYLKGLGVNKDFKMAFKFLHEAAKNGKSSAESEQVLAQAFLLGSVVPKNYEKAIQWYNLAAANGNKEAQNELGFMYFVGNGVEQDAEKGGAFFLEAAYNGLPVAQYNVGIMYSTGRGLKVTDVEKSYAWFNLAAANGHQQAKAARDYLESIMGKTELAAAQSYSEELMRTVTP